MIGYDIDGVLIRKDGFVLFQPTKDDVIVTGRSYQNAEKTYRALADISIFSAVYFNPLISKEVTPINAARWKSEMIGRLGITEFYEDDIEQIHHMRFVHPLVTFHHVS